MQWFADDRGKAHDDRWSDLRRDEQRLQVGRRVLAILLAFDADEPIEGPAPDAAEARDALAGIDSFSELDDAEKDALIDAITSLRSTTLDGTLDGLAELTDELERTLADEARLLAAER
jgi:hypothetical protein